MARSVRALRQTAFPVSPAKLRNTICRGQRSACSWNPYLFDLSVACHAVNKWLRSCCNAPSYIVVSTHETVRLEPDSLVRAPQIKTTNLVLLDCGALGQSLVEFPIVAEYDPPLSTNLCQPFVIRRRLCEFEFIPGIMMKLNGKRWVCRP